eukprot:4507735-Pleurochrysis_carterae.AAC.2
MRSCAQFRRYRQVLGNLNPALMAARPWGIHDFEVPSYPPNMALLQHFNLLLQYWVRAAESSQAGV